MAVIGAMIRNEAKATFHPVFFRPAPLPAGKDADMPAQRYRSLGHHTEGFSSIEEAREEMARICQREGWTASDTEFSWDGQDVPAITAWFSPPPQPAPAI